MPPHTTPPASAALTGRSFVSAQGRGHDKNNKLNKLVGKEWKQMTEAQRLPYLEKAAKDKLRFHIVRERVGLICVANPLTGCT